MKFTFEQLKKSLKPLKTMMWFATAICCINIYFAFAAQEMLLKVIYALIALYSFNMMNKSNRRYSNAANLDITITLEDSAKLFKQNVSNMINEKVYVIKDKFGIICTLPGNIEFDDILKTKIKTQQ
ncbi:MAG: hypothetical protein PUC86_05755 [Solobacterium sp.]|nr:hypothetical protein [Solobacterium sp.]MDY2731215.1 hypothetical protein [Erysipelotrichaceae bacterium]MDD5843067.1 hypothetical protein [Solobacterium sp.]MDD5982266.1 hypothetical protein [Solobacterium sp.]MDD6122711.1 hypothetical protein [Solobacterium sp.]